MKTIKYLLLFPALWMFSARAEHIDTAATRAYIQQYKDIAVEEMKRSGIPASITLAQGIHESGCGKSYLAVNTNNHFGIKCHENWTGKTFKYSDDAPDECFRAYDKAEDSYKDHSDFLRNRPRYADLFQLDKSDYKAWAYGLKKDGYATNPKYPDILIKTIEDFQLNLLDKGQEPSYISEEPAITNKTPETDPEFMDMNSPAAETPKTVTDEPIMQEVPIVDPENAPQVMVAPTQPAEQKIIRVNGKKAVLIGRNETLELIGSILNIPKEDLLSFNDIQKSSEIKEGGLLFIQQKKRRNRQGSYTVKAGDNMWLISQKEGLQLTALLRHNRMEPGEEAAVNEKLYLKGAIPTKPNLRPATETVKETIAPAPVAATQVKAPVFPAPEAQRPDNTADNGMPPPGEETKPQPKTDVLQDTDKLTADVSKTPTVENTPAPAVETKTVYPTVIDYAKLPKSTNGMHTVIKGDTMYNIAKRYNISLNQIMVWNNLPDQNIKLGQVLKIQP